MKQKFLLKTMLLLCALIVGSGNAWATDQKITLDYSSFGLTTSYATKTATVDGFGFTVNQGYKGSGNVIQMNSSKGDGTLFNTTAISGLKSIKVNVSSGNKTYTITTGTSQNPTANSQTGTTGGTYNAASGDTFFQLKVSGASYFSSIEITYDDSASGSTTYTVTYAANGGTGTMADNNSYEEGDEVTLLSNTFTAPEGKMWNSWLVKDASNATVTITGGKFFMPASNVTVTAQWADDPNAPQYEWVETSLSGLGSSDIFAIVGSNGGTYAMPNNYGTSDAPAVKSITIANGKIDTDVTPVTNDLRWNVSYDTTNGYTFYPNGSNSTWLYCNTTATSSSNNNMRVGTGDRKYFEMSGSYLKTKDTYTARYVSIYVDNNSTAQDWRGYTSSSTTIKFYKRQVVSTDPVISASDVDITYDATGGSIGYTLENATGNVSASVTTGDWLTLGTITSSSVPFTCAANTGAERTATVTLSYSGAENKVVTVTQAASPARYTTISDLFAGATTTATDVLVTFDNWVVSAVSTNGKNVFVTDGTNGFVINSSSDQSSTYAVGNILSGTAVPCSLKLNYGYAQLTSLDASNLTITTGGTVSAANVAMASLAGVNTGALVSYENLTCAVSGTTYTLTDGTTTIQLYTSLYNYTSDLENGHKYNVTGIYQQYNSTKEVLPRSSADIVEVFTPAIAATPASLTGFTYEVEDGPSTTKTISVSGSNLKADITLSLGNNSDFEMCLTENGTYTNSLTLTQSAGEVAATTVYVRMKADLAIGDSYSGTITLTSTDATDATVSLTGTVTAPVVDYATLPFSWSGGGKSDLTALNGVTGNNLPSDYAAANAPYLVKLDGTGDYIQIKTNEKPNRVYIGVKMLGGGTTSTIKVQASTDGSSFDEGEELSISGSQNDIVHLVSTRTFDSSVRHIRLYFTKGSNVGVGPISIIAGSSVQASVNSYGYGTFASGFPLDFSSVSNVSAWQITGVSGETITFSQITGTVASGTGVLLKREADGDIVIPVVSSGTDISSTNKLEGLTGYKPVTANTYYGLSGQTFVKVNAGTVPAGKALLPASVVNGSGVKAFTFVFEEDDPTGISTVNGEGLMANDPIYNLAGQRISKMQKGINIVNGKKVLK